MALRYRLFSASVLLDAAIVALALAAGINVVLGLVAPAFDGTWLWLRGGALPPLAATLLAAAFSVAVLVGRRMHPRGLRVARGIALLLAVACLADAIVFFTLVARGAIESALPVPLSLLVGLLLLVWALTARPPERQVAPNRRMLWHQVARGTLPLVFLVLGVGLHLVSFGATDYRRPGDAAVVLGAAVRPDGSPSGALLDRTQTACALYHEGLVDTLVLSGGRDPRAPLSEPACMRQIALEAGVPDHALVLDETGVTTAATVDTAATLARENGWSALLFVSHDYHLARIKLRAVRRGLRAYTVPANETRVMLKKPYFMAREVLAFAWYFTRLDA
ncbi:MAG: YdcF family protein [Planctomycetota bacterium]|nr:YdcF family protein [Planctomycetota bacterium]